MASKLCRRRRFLELLGYAALSVQLLPAGVASAVETAPADSLVVTSSRGSKVGRWADHFHLLYVPLRLLRAPPREGATLSTTWAFLHFHEVALSQDQLLTVAHGGTIRLEIGAHTFSIELS